jgi:hypothetical protein
LSLFLLSDAVAAPEIPRPVVVSRDLGIYTRLILGNNLFHAHSPLLRTPDSASMSVEIDPVELVFHRAYFLIPEKYY